MCWMCVAHARYLLIGNVLVWSITMLHVELDRQLSSSWITLQTISCSCLQISFFLCLAKKLTIIAQHLTGLQWQKFPHFSPSHAFHFSLMFSIYICVSLEERLGQWLKRYHLSPLDANRILDQIKTSQWVFNTAKEGQQRKFGKLLQ